MLGIFLGAGFLNWLGLIETVSEDMGRPFEDYTFTVAGPTVTNEVEYSGYEVIGDAYLIPTEGEEPAFSQTFSITQVDETAVALRTPDHPSG